MDDIWQRMKEGVPAGIPKIGMPLAPDEDGCEKWQDIMAKTEPISPRRPTRAMDDESLVVYTSGSTGGKFPKLHFCHG